MRLLAISAILTIMTEIHIPQASAQTINKVIRNSQPEDTLIFDDELYVLDEPLILLGHRTYITNAIFRREHGPMLIFPDGETDGRVIGTTICDDGWMTQPDILSS